MIDNRFAYTLLLYLMLPYALARLLWRSVRQPDYLRNIPERFGFSLPDGGQVPLIWIHAVSVGETHAAEPMIRALLARYPGHRVLLTHMTPTGREAGMRLFGKTALRCYLPYDFPGAMRRFLRHFRPCAGVLMETEIWPNLIAECRKRQVPVYLVNARLSEQSARRYRRFPKLAATSLDALAAVLAQTPSDAERFRVTGARRIEVTGNLKFDIDPPQAQIELGAIWRAAYGVRPVLLAASTRDGEEQLLFDHLDRLAPEALLVVVPRHPQRFDAVAALLEARDIRYQRRTDAGDIKPSTRVLLGDSMGEMFAYYAACDVAFIGGSLLPFGAHNLIEACAIGKPVLVGPSSYNFSDAVNSAVAIGAARRVDGVEGLMDMAARLLSSPAERRRMGEAGKAFSQAHRGATSRVVELVALGAKP